MPEASPGVREVNQVPTRYTAHKFNLEIRGLFCDLRLRSEGETSKPILRLEAALNAMSFDGCHTWGASCMHPASSLLGLPETESQDSAGDRIESRSSLRYSRSDPLYSKTRIC